MRPIGFLLLTVALATPALAQRPAEGGPPPAVVGRVVTDAGEPLPGASVTLRLPADSSLVTGAAAGPQGGFMLRGVPAGTYLLEATFVGFLPARQTVQYTGRQPVRAGDLTLVADPGVLGTVQVEAAAITVEQRGDTLAFDARRFQVNRDATAEDLVRRIPGASVQDGQVQIEGQAVQRVTLDGRDLFGGDPTTALRNLPADVVSQVETFEGRTDASLFSGFDDGERVRTVNLVSRANARNTAFGRVYGGGGPTGTYQAGLAANLIQGARRLNLVAQSNNINQQNFAVEDLIGLAGGGQGGPAGGRGGMRMMGGGGRPGGGGFGGEFSAGQQAGDVTTHALGVNYADRFGRRVDLTASYFGSGGTNELNQILDQQFVADALDGQRLDEQTTTDARTASHRASARLTVSLGPETALQVRPRLSTQWRRSTSAIRGETANDSGLLSQSTDAETARQLGVQAGTEVLVRHRFAGSSRTASAGLTTTYSDRDRTTDLLSETITSRPAGVLLLDQSGEVGTGGLGASVTGTLSQSFGQRHAALVTATVGNQASDAERLYVDLLTGAPVVDSTRSASLRTDVLTARAGTGYRFRGERLTLTTTLDGQLSRQARTQTFPASREAARSFYAALPTVSARYEWSRTRNLNLNLRGTTTVPSADQLDDALDIASALAVSQGNPDLRAETRLSGFGRFLSTNPDAGRTFVVGGGGDVSFNTIGTATTLAATPIELAPEVTLAPGGRFTRTENVGERVSGRLFASLGQPVRALRSNVSLNVFATHTVAPSLLNGEARTTRSTFLGPGLQVTSNLSPRVDFSVGTNSAATFARSSAVGGTNQTFLTQTSRAAVTVELPTGTVLRSDALHQTFVRAPGSTPYLLWNASVGQRFLPGRPAEVRLAVTDLLSQNANYTRTVNDVFVQGLATTNALQRYVQLVLTYTVRPNTGR